MEFKLCYLDDTKHCAYFTSQNPRQQCGDDWNNVPYEHNAGEPYEDEAFIKKVFFELPTEYKVPCSGYSGSPYSVEEINRGVIAWIWNDKFKLFADTTIEDFIETIQKNEGKVYVELEGEYGNKSIFTQN